MALHKVGRNQEALDMLSSAIDTDHKNPLARFEKAHVLMSTDQLHAALQELETLKVHHSSAAPAFHPMHLHRDVHWVKGNENEASLWVSKIGNWEMHVKRSLLHAM